MFWGGGYGERNYQLKKNPGYNSVAVSNMSRVFLLGTMEMNRRKLLGTVGAVGSFGVSGCLDSVDPRGSQIQLAHYWLSNYTSEPVRLEARVDRDGETVHEETYDVEPKDDDEGTLGVTSVECTWGDTAGEYILYARRQGW